MCVVCDDRRSAERAARLPHTATVFLRPSGRVYISSPDTDTVLQAVMDGSSFRAIDTEGREVVLTPKAYVNAVGPKPVRDAIEVPSSIFDGRHIKITSVANLVRAEGEDIDPDGEAGLASGMVRSEDAPYTVSVIAQDLADATVLIMDLRKADDDLIWINPAADPKAIDLTVKAVRALAEAEQREILCDTEGIGVTVGERHGIPTE